MTSPVAIVTGGSSGIGWALVQRLLSLGWRVVIADIHAPPKGESLPDDDNDDDKTLFIKTDVSSWEQQADMFKRAYEWGKRLDFCALNAGIDDRDDIFNTLSRDVDKPPRRPNTITFDVNVTGTYYGIKLAAHYMTLPDAGCSGKSKPGGKIVITASGTGIFPIPAIPQYTASKHALVGLVRALGMGKAALAANVRINAVCPAIVATPGLPAGLVGRLPPAQITPMDTIMRCFDAVADLADFSEDDWVERGKSGETVEGNVGDLIWHYPPRPQQQKQHQMEGSADLSGNGDKVRFVRETGALLVAEAYKERIRRFAMQEEEVVEQK